MGLDSIRPWDLVVDTRGRAPLQPFKATPELVQGCERVFEKVDPVFSEELQEDDAAGPPRPREPPRKGPGRLQL